MDLGSVNAPPPLDHRQSGVGWLWRAPRYLYKLAKKGQAASKKGIMSRRVENPAIFIHHWRWLEANGYKRQAASCKLQAASLTRKYYNDIQEYTGEKKNENK